MFNKILLEVLTRYYSITSRFKCQFFFVKEAQLEEVKLFFHFSSLVISIFVHRECNQITDDLVKVFFLFLAFSIWIENDLYWLFDVLIYNVL